MPDILLPVPHILQRQPGECLAACAAMLLNYRGQPVDYKWLLALLRVRSGVGAPASNIRFLEQTGVQVIYKQGSWAELRDHLAHNRPCLALVKTGELPYWTEDSDHALVVVGFETSYVYLNDPEFPDAPLRVPLGDFDLAWLGRDEYYACIK
jgi:ABC-type bacteriocin/lantibiotic exporter with double-glycine peptidase domain